jgi:outer membrane protein OmpA-like peptidoglycan-associated protein
MNRIQNANATARGEWFWTTRMFVDADCNITRAIIAGCILLSMIAPGAATDCQTLVEHFNRAVDERRENVAQVLVDEIATSSDCGRFQVPAQRRIAALRLSTVQSLMSQGRPLADFERLLDAADATEVLWQASATLAEVRFRERRFVEAALAYDRAIEIVKNETLTPLPPSKVEIESLIMRAAQARLLVANSSRSDAGMHVKTARNQRDGKLGGFYSPSVRGIVPHALPIPITFEYGTTVLTPVGERAARELSTVLKEQQPSHITLVGHTDARGSADFNMKLSLERAAAVASFLRAQGIEIPTNTVGKGATEPMILPEASGLSQEDIYALNRRVEWRRE